MKRSFILIFCLFILGYCHDKEDKTLKLSQTLHHPVLMPGQKAEYNAKNNNKTVEFRKKSRKTGKSKTGPGTLGLSPQLITEHVEQDSVVVRKINFLRSREDDLDMNEPMVRNFLHSGLPAVHFPPELVVSRECFIKINFDNDILDYTDRFYTNGLRFDLISPAIAGNPANKLLLPYWSAGTNYYGLSLVQNLYTPSTTKTGGILYGDRPYAAYLFLGCFKITNDPVHKFRQTSELDLGIIGPWSFGEWVQRSFHQAVPSNNEPLGWEFQIKNDVVLNYSAVLEKGVWNTRGVDFNLITAASLGTLYTHISGGFLFRTGWMNPYFSNLGIARRGSLARAGLKKMQCIFFFKGSGKLIGYDATLEGGMINRSSTYTLSPDEITRMVFQTSAGISLTLNGFRIDAEQFILSPEFKHGFWHKWVHIGLTFCL